METIQGNKLIARFMGGKQYPIGKWWHLPNTSGYVTTGKLKYHTSWDWLMPVVQKIRDMPMIKGLVLAQTSYWENILEALTVVEIDTLFLAVIAFITWYNSQQPLITSK